MERLIGGGRYDNINKLKMVVTAGNEQICSDIARMDLSFCHVITGRSLAIGFLHPGVGDGKGKNRLYNIGQYGWYLLLVTLLERQIC